MKTNNLLSFYKHSVRIFIYLLLFSFPAASLQAQTINLSRNNVRLADVFNEIEKQTQMTIGYRESAIDTDRMISVNIVNKSLNDAMNDVLKGTNNTFRIQGKQILIVSQTSSTTQADKRIITGNVTDETGESIIGANVVEKGTSNGVITDINGNFSISLPASGNTILEISFIGYVTQEIPLTNQTQVSVVLRENAQTLDEVVVIGYGTMKKRDLTGSIVQIKADRFANETPTSVQDLLRGAPGLNIGISNSAEGGGSMQIRGQRSLNAENDPLIVLDNMIFGGSLAEINPQDIETIDVLKDASSAAIYGSKSANGVIIITTKKGKSPKPVIRVDANVGIVTLGVKRDLYSPEGFLKFRGDVLDSREGFVNPGKFAKPSSDNLSQYGLTLDDWRAYDQLQGTDDDIWLTRLGLYAREKENYYAGNSVDWYDQIFQTGLRQDYNISLAGRSDKVNYYLSMGYLNSKGILTGDEFNTIRSNIKVDAVVNSFLELGANLNFSHRTDENITDIGGDWDYQLTRNSPYGTPWDDDGNLVVNPLGINSYNAGYNNAYHRQFYDRDRKRTILNAVFNAKVKLPFNIVYSFNFAPRFQWNHNREWYSSEHAEWTYNGRAIRDNSNYLNWMLNNTINWEYTFAEKHRVNVTLSQEAEQNNYWSNGIDARDILPTDALGYHYIDGANKLLSSFESNDTQSTGDALLGRLFYSYDNRYMTTLSVRRDGYSAFGMSNPRATFTSAAFAWNFTSEKFFNWEPMNHGKLRVSWGSNGNRALPSKIGGVYTALSNLTGGDGGYAYINPISGAIEERQSLYASRMPNHGLKWEKTASWNLAVDFGFLGNRINGSLEYYYMPTTDLIMSRSLVEITGFGSVTTNLGEVLNQGVEISLNSNNIRTRNFNWNTTLGLSYNKNEIKHLYYTYEDVYDENGNFVRRKESDDISKSWFIGKPISALWNYQFDGIWQLGEEEEAAKYGLRPGDAKTKDVNEDGTFTNEDKDFLGQKAPKVRWSMRNDFTFFKNFTASVNIYSSLGHKDTSTDYRNTGTYIDRANSFVVNYWTPDNPTNKYARLNSSGTAPRVIDKSFVRLESISLAYDVPKEYLSKFMLSSLKIYANVRNVATWTKEWDLWDVETNSYLPRTFSFGVNLTF